MTGNQLVAFNLRRAREEAGLTQEQAAALLEPYIGRRWSKAVFSIAERSADQGARKRLFDANELLAFSQVFKRPLAWFFTPPPEAERIKVELGGDRILGRGELLELVTPTDLFVKTYARQLQRIVDGLDPAARKESDA
jgi:transcriptional regulator with XRE-family HTH domain